MTKKFQSIVIALSLIAGFIGLLMEYTMPSTTSGLLLMGFELASITALIMLIQNGRFIHTKYFRGVQLCISVLIIGALFRLMHWPFGSIIASSGMLAIIFIYSFWFSKKRNKTLLDILKVIWVILAYGFGAGAMFHLIPRNWLWIPQILLWIVFILYTAEEYRKQQAGKLSNR